MKKFLLLLTLFILSINNLQAADLSDNCKNTVDTASYDLLNDGFKDAIFNIADKLHKKIEDKTREYQVNYFGKLINILDSIGERDGLKEKQGQIILLLKNSFECKLSHISLNNAQALQIAGGLTAQAGNVGTEPDIDSYTFINGTDLNKDEIIRYFNDFEEYRNGRELIDFSFYNEKLSVRDAPGTPLKNYYIPMSDAINWFKSNIYDLKYFPRLRQSFHSILGKHIIKGAAVRVKSNKYERIVGLRIVSKIISDMMPPGYIEYPTTNQDFFSNKTNINEWLHSVGNVLPKTWLRNLLSGETNNERKRLLSVFSSSYGFIPGTVWNGCNMPADGKYADYPKKGWGPANGLVFSSVPSEDKLCYGLYLDNRIKSYLSGYNPYIKYGRDKLDYKGNLYINCFSTNFNQSCMMAFLTWGSIYWERTTVLKIISDKISEQPNTTGFKHEYLLANSYQAKSYCKSKGYLNGKVLREQKAKPQKIIHFLTNPIIGRETSTIQNNSEVDLIEYVKCWNGTETSDDPDLTQVENSFNGKGDYASEISNGIRVVQLASNYYRKVKKAWDFPESAFPEIGGCDYDTLGETVKVGMTTYECAEKENDLY